MLFKSRQICEALEIGKKGRLKTKFLTKSGHYLKHIKVVFFLKKESEGKV